jgi:hypothetical protein
MACSSTPFIACGDDANYLSLHGKNGPMDGDAASEGGMGQLDGSLRDGGFDAMRDAAGKNLDGSASDLDASSLNLPDGSVILPDGGILLPDGTVIDFDTAVMRYGDETDVSGCSLMDDNRWETSVSLQDEGEFELVPGPTGFGLAYQATGTETTCGHAIDLIHIPSTSGFPAPHAVMDSCDNITDVTLLADKDGWQMAWVDNSTNTAELHTIGLDADMNVPKAAKRTTLTTNVDLLERKPVLKRVATRPLIVWTTQDPKSDAYSLTAQFLDKAAGPTELLKAADGHKPQALGLAQMGMSNAAVGWVGPIGNPGVWIQALDSDAKPVGEPVKLTTKVGASSSIDIASRLDGGGAIYSIEIDGIPQIRYRRLNETGEPVADERVIVGPPLRADGASLALLGNGFAVAYRALSGGSIVEPEIDLTFITKEGNIMRDGAGRMLSFKVGDATMVTARPYVSVSVEGQIMVAWLDLDGTTGKNLLKVVRRRLDCR